MGCYSADAPLGAQAMWARHPEHQRLRAQRHGARPRGAGAATPLGHQQWPLGPAQRLLQGVPRFFGFEGPLGITHTQTRRLFGFVFCLRFSWVSEHPAFCFEGGLSNPFS